MRIASVRAYRNGIRSSFNGRLRRHDYGRGELILSAERHEYGARAYRAVEHFAETLLRTYVEP